MRSEIRQDTTTSKEKNATRSNYKRSIAKYRKTLREPSRSSSFERRRKKTFGWAWGEAEADQTSTIIVANCG